MMTIFTPRPQKTALAAFVSTFFFSPVVAANTDVAELDVINVVADTAPVQTGATVLLSEDIARKPLRNGNITELLKNNPAVQFSGSTNNSTQAGEIAPDLVSFHGEPYYNNSHLIDGLSNNDLLNPGASNGGYKSAEDFTEPTSMYLAPGSPESFYINSALLKNVTVYDSNAPAKYGRFTGGVIDAEIQDPDLSRPAGSLSYRTTRDSWTTFQLSDDEAEDFDKAYAESNVQPKFTKHIFDFTFNQPINSQAGILFAYNRTQSKMPEYHVGLNRWEKERRLAETFLLKGSYALNDHHTLAATALYSPHKNTYFRDNSKNGRYVAEGGGWRFNLESQFKADWGRVKTVLGYQINHNNIRYDAGADFYNWIGNANLNNAATDWCTLTVAKSGKCAYKREGGIGELRSNLKTWTLKQDYDLNPFNWGGMTHTPNFGWQIDLARAESQRPHAVRYMSAVKTYKDAENKNRIISPTFDKLFANIADNCVDCLPHEQFQNAMTYYPAFKAKTAVNNYSLYLSDEIEWQRLKLVPGVNVNYDSFLKNLNIAPRFAFNVNVLDNGLLNITGGYNRYFAGNMLAYALRAAVPCNRRAERYADKNGSGEWQMGDCANNSVSWDNARNLKTPYSDEYNLGFNSHFANHSLVFNWVHRKSQRQFTPGNAKAGETKTLTNDGQGQTNTFSLSLQNHRPYHLSGMEIRYRTGVRYQHRKTNYHGNYDESLVSDPAALTDRYYLFDGKRYASVSELPPFNFNLPWEGFAEVQTDVPAWHLQWTHSLNYRTGHKAYTRHHVARCADSSQPQACGDYSGAVYDYRLKNYKAKATLDWHFLWTLPLAAEQRIELNLDILNLFNSRIATASPHSSSLGGTESQSLTGYELGRQFWFGMAYRW